MVAKVTEIVFERCNTYKGIYTWKLGTGEENNGTGKRKICK